MSDIYTFTLYNGTVLRYTNNQVPLTLGANTWLAVGPLLQRSAIRQMRGLEVDTLDIQVTDDGSTLLNASTFLSNLRAGLLDGAQVLLQRVFFSAPSVLVNSTGVGDLILFSGRVGEIDVGRLQATIRCNSLLALLNTQMPRNQYQPGCVNTLYDTACTLNKAAYTFSGYTAAAGSTAGSILLAAAPQQNYFELGVIAFTSGANSGYSRTIRAVSGSIVYPTAAFPFAVAAGDTCTLRPGCDKQQSTCQSKFGNLANFRGTPYVPVVTAVVNY